MTDDTGNSQGIGYGKPPKDTQFGKPKGNRQNRLGRPKSFDALRKLAQQVLAEAIETGDGEKVTRITAMLKLMSSSRNPADRKTLLEYAYGKPKEEISVRTDGRIIIEYADQDSAAAPTQRPADDQGTAEEA